MKFIPATPTDNLYKFMAIFGLWLSIGLLLIMAWFKFATFQSMQESQATQSYYYSKDIDRKVLARMKAIDEGRMGDDKFDLSSDFKTPKDEMTFLKVVHENHQSAIAKAEPVMNRHTGESFEFLDAMGIKWILPSYAGFCIFVAFLGFQGWHGKIQRPADKLVPVEFQIKETELKLKGTELKLKEIELKLKEAELRRVEREENVPTQGASPVPGQVNPRPPEAT